MLREYTLDLNPLENILAKNTLVQESVWLLTFKPATNTTNKVTSTYSQAHSGVEFCGVLPVSRYQNVNKIKQGLDFVSHTSYSLNNHQSGIIFLWGHRVQMRDNSVTQIALPN